MCQLLCCAGGSCLVFNQWACSMTRPCTDSHLFIGNLITWAILNSEEEGMRVMSLFPWVTVRAWEAGQGEIVTNDQYETDSFSLARKFIYFECKLKRTFIIFLRRSFMSIYCKYVHLCLWKKVSYALLTNSSILFDLDNEMRLCMKRKACLFLTEFTHSFLASVTFNLVLQMRRHRLQYFIP